MQPFIKKIREGKDISVSWPILTNGEELPLEGRDLRLELINPVGGVIVLDFRTEDNVIHADLRARNHKRKGIYSLRLFENFDKPGQSAVDADAFHIVARSADERLTPPPCPHHDAASATAPEASADGNGRLSYDPASLGVEAVSLAAGNLTIGDKGADGVGIADLRQLTFDRTPGASNTVRVTLTDGRYADFQLFNPDVRMLTVREWPADGIPVDNTKYVLGSISRLDIAALPDTNDEGILVYFTAAEGFTFACPAGTPWMGEYAPEILPGKRYLISIVDGICSVNQINVFS